MDRISPIFNQLRPNASVFFTGQLCTPAAFTEETSGHLHLLKCGTLHLKDSSGVAQEFSQPTLIFIAKPLHHSLNPGGQSTDLICAHINFGNRTNNPVLRSFPSIVAIPLSSAISLGPLIEIIFHEAFGTHCAKQLALNRLLDYLLILLFRHVVEHQMINESALLGLSDPRLSRAITAIHESPDKLWSLELLAKEAGMSRTRFADMFRQTVGQTPMDYLTDWRISLAQTLLLSGKNIKAIASKLGYQNPSSFTRVFLKKTGRSPLEWQKVSQTTN